VVRLPRHEALRLLCLPAAAAAFAPSTVVAQDLTTIRVGASIDTGLRPLLYALQAGLFPKAGLDVQVSGGSNGAALAAGVAGGALDFAKSALMPLITARARGVEFKLVAGASEDSVDAQSNIICTLKTSGIASLAEATGKTVVVSTLRGLDMLGTQVLIDRAGGDSSKVNFIELPISAMWPALQQGRADFAALAYPFLPEAIASGKIVMFTDPYRGLGNDLVIAGWFTTAEYAKTHRDVIDRFAAVLTEASVYVNTHHQQAAQIMADYTHIDLAVVMKMSHLKNPTKIDVPSIQRAIDAAAKYKYISAGFLAKELVL
jgi:NitT/TauT family transport system substrate-binding protein